MSDEDESEKRNKEDSDAINVIIIMHRTFRGASKQWSEYHDFGSDLFRVLWQRGNEQNEYSDAAVKKIWSNMKIPLRVEEYFIFIRNDGMNFQSAEWG